MKFGLIECFVIDNVTNACHIETDLNPIEVDLYWSYSTDKFDKKDYIDSFDQKNFEFKRIQSKDKRIYYHLIINKANSFVAGERILKIDGMYNFRDMGGYPTKDGRRVKWGLLYRGDQLANSESSSDQFMLNLGIQSIIDLRSKLEIEKDPNRCISDIAQTHNLDPNAHIAAFAGHVQNTSIFSDRENLIESARKWLSEGKTGSENMIEQQKEFVLSSDAKAAFSKALKVVMNAENSPVFQHCRGGKDRTGYIAMLELMILGVDRKYVIYDYLLTNKARELKNQKYREKFLEMTQNEEYTDFYMSLFESKEEYISAAIDLIYQNYTNVVNYVISELGITSDQILRFKEYYLE